MDIGTSEKMEHPKDEPYHVRPFPRQPQRGTKELIEALKDLETACGAKVPDFEGIRAIQERIHKEANTYTDDKLIDMLRILSLNIDDFERQPGQKTLENVMKQILKVRVELKHL